MSKRTQRFSARRDGVVVEELAGELLIYDRRTDVAHCLSEVAAVAWRTCADRVSVVEIADQIVAGGLAGTREEAIVLADAAVAELGEKGLLDGGLEDAPRFISERVPRRQALRRLAGAGIAAATGPLVLSVAVPNAYAHASSNCPTQIYYAGSNSSGTYYFQIPPSEGSNYALTGCSSITSGGLPRTGLQCGDYGVSGIDSGVCSDLRILVSGSTYYVCSTDSKWTPDTGASFISCPNTSGAGCLYYSATSVDPPAGLASVCNTEALMFTCGSGPNCCVKNGYSCSSNNQCCSSNCHSGVCS